jgi:Helix-turn-helix domain
MKKTQLVRIHNHLNKGRSITPIQALEQFGCFRLSARILDLKKLGLRIQRKTIFNRNTGKKFASYSLAK